MLVALLYRVTEALETNQYAVVLALDFSKTFDTVSHCSFVKVAQLDLPDNVYNWLANFFHGHSHCMQFNSHASLLQNVNAMPA